MVDARTPARRALVARHAPDAPSGGVRTLELVGSSANRIIADECGPENGPTVLLLHGAGQTRCAWTETLLELGAQGWRAISADLRGHGQSDWIPNGDYALAAFAADVTAVVDQLGAPAALVGASLGGTSSLLAIGEHPEPARFASCLVLVDCAHRSEAAGQRRIRSFMNANPDGFGSIDEAAVAVSKYNRGREHRRPTLDGLTKNLRQRPDGRWVWHWDPQFMFGDDSVEATFDPVRLIASARRVRTPVLLVRGRSSDAISATIVDEFVELVPHTEVAEVARAGHMVVGDRNARFNDAVIPFLRRTRHDPGPGRSHLSPREHHVVRPDG